MPVPMEWYEVWVFSREANNDHESTAFHQEATRDK